jgi:acetate kinase
LTPGILIFNVGSSSIKFALYQADNLSLICRGEIGGIGNSIRLREKGGTNADALSWLKVPSGIASHAGLSEWLLQSIAQDYSDIDVAVAGHRVVHGGSTFGAPTVADAAVLDALKKLTPLAPNHQPPSLAPIDAAHRLWPKTKQIACFDTAFHRTQPPIAQLFALPRELINGGIIRFGFHGLSYEYISHVLPKFAGPRAKQRVIIAHLGHGASMCALKNGDSVATTMGFTALDGLVMGSRCGSIDPGVILYMLEEKKMSANEIANMLYNQSGLLGVSGLSDDMRELEASSDPHAQEAIELFVYRAAREIGSLVSALGGLDVLVFTAGIGEHSANIREQICDRSSWLGIELDKSANAKHGPKISKPNSKVDVFALKTDEEFMIARSAQKFTAYAATNL